MISTRWQGIIALLLLIVISYVDRVNISVMILNPDFAAHFRLNDNRMLQGTLMTAFLVGYGFSALLLTPVLESKLHCRQALLICIIFWAVICALSPFLGSLFGLLLARLALGIAEGPLFSLKTRYINDNFTPRELGKPNAVSALGVSLGLAVGFPLVTWLVSIFGWSGSFLVLALMNLLLGGGLVLGFIPRAPHPRPLSRLRFRTTLTCAWRTPLLGWMLLIEIATLSYLWGNSAWLPAWLREEHGFSLHATGWLAAVPFLISLGAKYLGGVLLDRLRPQQAPLLFVTGGAATACAVTGLMFSHQYGWLAFWLLAANACWGVQGAAIPVVVQHHARSEAVGSAYGIINGIGNLCAAFIPLLMGAVMSWMGTVSSGFAVLAASQIVTLFAGSILLIKMRLREASPTKSDAVA